MSVVPKNIGDYLRQFANQLEEKILQQFPPLHQPGEPLPPELARLRRKPYPAQALAVAAIAKRWDVERSAGAIAECGTGKTLISLGAIFVHAKGRPFTALAMVPPREISVISGRALTVRAAGTAAMSGRSPASDTLLLLEYRRPARSALPARFRTPTDQAAAARVRRRPRTSARAPRTHRAACDRRGSGRRPGCRRACRRRRGRPASSARDGPSS